MQRLLAEFTREAQERDNLMKSLLALHEKEIGRMETANSPLELTKQQTETLLGELKTLEEITDIGVRSNKVADVTDLITPSLFRNLADAVEEKCPLLRNIIESLVVSNHQERNVRKKIVIKEGREGGYQIPVPSLNLAQIPVPRLIFAKIPVTKSKIPLVMIICKIMRIIN